MPQSIQLIDGSVADNIGRFDPEADPKTVVAAGQAAHAPRNDRQAARGI
jgi:ABC-type protease/lipase transport system fused ATPase/permease subunit